MLADSQGNCKYMVMLYTSLARSVGVPVRPALVNWPVRRDGHCWTEVWDPDKKGWHSVDSSAPERFYRADWVLRVAKASIHAATGERGAWNADSEGRWEAYTNTVGLFYPSGTLVVRVLERGAPKANQRVEVQTWLRKTTDPELLHLTSAKTDRQGETRFTLGQSARQPYRFVLAGEDQPDWEWLAVKAGEHYELTLHADYAKPFDLAAKPPPLGFPQWEPPQDTKPRNPKRP